MAQNSAILTIDGAQGEGGGQILRTSLALSMITGTPFRLVNIRAGRARPGLMRQHLTSVLAAAEVGNAEVVGAAVGSMEITFLPRSVTPRHFTFKIGTAGSTTLVLQTVLPALMLASGPSVVTIEGGTHNTHAPPFEYLERVFIPLINRMGPRVSVRLTRYGFFPAGGGRIIAEIDPVPRLAPLTIIERGAIVERRAVALVSQLPGHVAQRELDVVREKLSWAPEHVHIRGTRDSHSPGNALMIELASEGVTELFTAIGEVGKTAEAVADEAVAEARDYIRIGAPVGIHLADQLILPLALAGAGQFVTQSLVPHTRTNIETVARFLPTRVDTAPGPDETVRVSFH